MHEKNPKKYPEGLFRHVTCINYRKHELKNKKLGVFKKAHPLFFGIEGLGLKEVTQFFYIYICALSLTQTNRKARTSSDKRTGGLAAEEAAAIEGDCVCDTESSPAAP
jgi:hypothetical protein